MAEEVPDVVNPIQDHGGPAMSSSYIGGEAGHPKQSIQAERLQQHVHSIDENSKMLEMRQLGIKELDPNNAGKVIVLRWVGLCLN